MAKQKYLRYEHVEAGQVDVGPVTKVWFYGGSLCYRKPDDEQIYYIPERAIVEYTV